MSMPVSGFELQLLQLLWKSTLALTLLAMLLSAAFAIRRKYEEWHGARNEVRRERLSGFILASLRSPMHAALNTLPMLEPGDESMLTRLALDFLRVLRGNDKDRIVQIIKSWNLFPYLRRQAEKGSRAKRIQAITLLGYFDDMESLVVLMEYAEAKDMDVQLTALRCLAERGATKYIGRIITKLQKTRKADTLMLADVLSRFGENAVPSLIALARSSAIANVRTAVILALDHIGSLRAIEPLLLIATRDASIEVRAQAICALGKLGDARAGPVLASCLKDPDREIRLQAAASLGKLSYQKALPSLVSAMNDEEESVRLCSAQALCKSGNNGIAMLKALSRDRNNAGKLAEKVLREMKEPDSNRYHAA